MSVVGNNKEPYESHIGSRMKKIAKKGNKQGVEIKSKKSSFLHNNYRDEKIIFLDSILTFYRV